MVIVTADVASVTAMRQVPPLTSFTMPAPARSVVLQRCCGQVTQSTEDGRRSLSHI